MSKPILCTWHLLRNCNFSCEYCYIRHMRKDEPGHGVDVDIEALKKNNVKWGRINMSGGEPFIYPHFVELCKKMTAFTSIIVTTNCSTSNVLDFADSLDPRKVDEVHCSLHLGQRKDFDAMIERILYLRERNHKVFVSQVIHPRLINEYAKVFEHFKQRGILVSPKVMNGIYHLKEYPQGYTEKQKRTILKYADLCSSQVSSNNLHRYATMVNGRMNWKGRLCSAGMDILQIQYNGDAFRCEGDRRLLGNLYEGTITLDTAPTPCQKSRCCELEGWYGHRTEGFIDMHYNPINVAKGYAATLLAKRGKVTE